MKKYSIYAALDHARDMYGVELDEDTFEVYAMSAWTKIGNKDYKLADKIIRNTYKTL